MRNRIFFQKIIFVIIMSQLMLSGCSVFSPVKMEARTTYVLNQLPASAHKKTTSINILVVPAQNNLTYDTQEIAYTIEPYQVGYYSNHQWVQRPSEMLLGLIAQSLQNTHHYHAVVTSSILGRYSYVVSFEIVKLVQDYSHVGGRLSFVMRAQILRVSDNRIIATKEFVVNRPIWQKSPYNGIIAANAAVAQAVQQLTQFCLQHT